MRIPECQSGTHRNTGRISLFRMSKCCSGGAVWKQHRHTVLVAPVQSRAPPRGRQPKAQPSQPPMLLEAIRPAPQPPTRVDVRQTPGVKPRQLKRHRTLLLVHRKVQERPDSTLVASTEGAQRSAGREASPEPCGAPSRDDDTVVTAMSDG
jgi:hypothetical protein